MNDHIVIFSHGFGVRQDSRGTFTDIAAQLPGAAILFDYNTFDEASNTLTITPFPGQIEKLRNVIIDVRAAYPNAKIDLVCHSQGCIIAGLLKPTGIHKFILLAPPATLNIERMSKIFGRRPGAQLDLNGQSVFPRTDGTTSIVPKEYWDGVRDLHPINLYNDLARLAPVAIIHAGQDQIIEDRNFTGISPSINSATIDGADHDFTGAARPQLIAAILKEVG